jgi:hypothetical protein
MLVDPLRVVELSPNNTEHTLLVKEFCEQCNDSGYTNNSSLASMKWDGRYDLPDSAQWWGVQHKNKLITVSGCHSFGPFNPKFPQLRTLFRSATLPQFSNIIPGLSRTHMNSQPFSLLLPNQILWGLKNNFKYFFITTSDGTHDASGLQWRAHRTLEILSKRSIVNFESKEIIYSQPQFKWRINISKYIDAVESFRRSTTITIVDNYQETIDAIKQFF